MFDADRMLEVFVREIVFPEESVIDGVLFECLDLRVQTLVVCRDAGVAEKLSTWRFLIPFLCQPISPHRWE